MAYSLSGKPNHYNIMEQAEFNTSLTQAKIHASPSAEQTALSDILDSEYRKLWNEESRKQYIIDFTECIKATHKNKERLISFINFYAAQYDYYKYMWKPFKTEDLVEVRQIMLNHFNKVGFDTLHTSKVKIAMLGAFDNMKDLSETINLDFIDSLSSLQSQQLDVTNVWHSLLKLSNYVHENNKFNAIWHHVVPNTLEIRVHDAAIHPNQGHWMYDYSPQIIDQDVYEVIGTVHRTSFSPEDANWETSKFYKQAYLDKKLKGK